MMISDLYKHSRLRKWCVLLASSIKSWWDGDPFTQSAAVAYYTIFSFPALMILYFASASFFVEEEVLQAQAYGFLSNTFGEASSEQFKDIISKTAPEETSIWAVIIGGTTLLFAALKLFLQFQKALNHIWQVKEEEVKGIRMLLARRAISFAVMIGVGFTLAVSLIMTSLISLFTEWMTDMLPAYFAILAHLFNIFVSFTTITIMFGIILKTLPDVHVKWKHALPGAMLAAILFMFGQYMLGIYFSVARPDSAYGVTGSLILLMLWVSYSCVILLLGAEFSKVLTRQSHHSNKAVVA